MMPCFVLRRISLFKSVDTVVFILRRKKCYKLPWIVKEMVVAIFNVLLL
jgi:hypothetical protein